MRKIIENFIKYPIYANAIIVVTAIAGILSLILMPKSFVPEMSPNKIYVNVSYPGASPEEIEEGITTRIEESLNGIEGVKEITSMSSENISRVTVEIYNGIDIDLTLQDIKNSIDGIYSFPLGAEKPNIQKQKSRGMGGIGNIVGFYSLNGPDNLWKLKELSDKIEKKLLNEKAISQLQVIGFPPEIISIEVKEEDLLRHNLNFDIISSKIRTSNIDMSGGYVKTNKDVILIRSNNRKIQEESIKEIVIYSDFNGNDIKVGDIANVERKFSESIPITSYVNGKRSVNFIIEKTNDEDIKEIAETVEEFIETFNLENKDYQIIKLFQFSDLLDQRINTLLENLFLGLVLVLIVLGLFLSLRLSLWVAFGIPFSFIGMISIGLLYGMSINMISLFGMILVVGIIVDDGIVIAENIYSHFEKGKSPMKAALDGTVEVISPVLTSILTTVLAFSSLLFVGGEMEMLQEMAFAVIACLLFSLIEAFLILPSHLSTKKAFNSKKYSIWNRITFSITGFILVGIFFFSLDSIWDIIKLFILTSSTFLLIFFWPSIKKIVEKFVHQIRNIYTKINTVFVKWYRFHVWTPIVFILLVSILLATGVIRWTFFPSVPFNDVTIEFAYKPGEREYRTENFLWYCDSIIQSYKEELTNEYNDTLITNTSLTIGFTEALNEQGSHAGSIRISIKENDFISTIDISNEIQRRINKDSLNQLEKISVGGQQTFGKAVSISLQSENAEQLNQSVIWLKNQVKTISQVKEVLDNGGVGNREIHLSIKEKAYNLGLNEASIMKQIRQGFFGEEVQRLIIGRDEVKMWIQYPINDRNNISDLDNMRIRASNGNLYPLEELAYYEFKRGKVKINHINGNKEVTVDANLYDSEYSGEVNSEIERKYLTNLKQEFPEVEYKLLGQAEEAAEAGRDLGIAFVISIILILITISLNFKSFYQARLILMVVPVGVFSAILGHGLVGRPFSMLSIWGVVALIGILVNDAVVMLDRYNRNLKEGMNLQEAVIQAGRSRFRPIILTTITTFVGLFPLILEKSFQAQFLIPMATSVAFGVLFGTLILLFYFPSLILYFNDLKRLRVWIWNGGKKPPTKFEVEPVNITKKRFEELNSK